MILHAEFEYLVLTPLELAQYLPDGEIPGPYGENKALNILGKQGWELVAIFGSTRIYNYYFKRKL